jgi:hypothetical protein
MAFDQTNSTDTAVASCVGSSPSSSDRLIDPRVFGLTRAAYDVAGAMTVLSMGRGAIYRAINEGRLRATKNGGRTSSGAVFSGSNH